MAWLDRLQLQSKSIFRASMGVAVLGLLIAIAAALLEIEWLVKYSLFTALLVVGVLMLEGLTARRLERRQRGGRNGLV